MICALKTQGKRPRGDITLFLLPPLTSQASLLSSNTEDVEIPTSDNSLITSNQALWDVAPRKHGERCSSQVPAAAPQFSLWQLAASSTRRPRLNTGAEARLPLTYLSLRWGKTWVWSPRAWGAGGQVLITAYLSGVPPPPACYGRVQAGSSSGDVLRRKPARPILSARVCVYSMLARCPSFLIS